MLKLISKIFPKRYKLLDVYSSFIYFFKELVDVVSENIHYHSSYYPDTDTVVMGYYDKNKVYLIDVNRPNIKNESVIFKSYWGYTEWSSNLVLINESITSSPLKLVKKEIEEYVRKSNNKKKTCVYEFEIHSTIMGFLKEGNRNSDVLKIMCDFLKERDLEYPFFEKPNWNNIILDYLLCVPSKYQPQYNAKKIKSRM